MNGKFLNINTIYSATEGEGILIGTPQVFVRFQGCSIGCLNCDSKDTWSFKESGNYSIESTMKEIASFNIPRVSITGGDPLHPKNIDAVITLARVLKSKGFFINLEAAGTKVVDSLFDIIDFISFDFKTLSTGVKIKKNILKSFIIQYGNKAQIKSVIETKEDFCQVKNLFEEIQAENNFTTPWVLTPAYNPGQKFDLSFFEWIIQENEKEGHCFRVIGQQHKWIFGPDRTDV